MKLTRRVPRLLIVLWCLTMIFTVMQVLYGSIVGTLTDETGGVVPNASVTVTNTSTGLSKQATANDVGYYSIPNLPEGSYDMSVTFASGIIETLRVMNP